MSNWRIFQGTPSEQHDESALLQSLVPPWRRLEDGAKYRARTYLPSEAEIEIVNSALYLRRPLLLTGPPGSGKSSLAYAVAEELKLGPVLKWAINSRSTLQDGLYHYDAIARLRDAQTGSNVSGGGPAFQTAASLVSDNVAQYLKLQWLGAALASQTPRVVLIDEIDKADIDLPNDLLHVLEDGTFLIPELLRIADQQPNVDLRTCEVTSDEQVCVNGGIVRSRSFPLIVLTSNGEREMPLALHRRCLRLQIDPPDKDRLQKIVASHLKDVMDKDSDARKLIDALIDDFLKLRLSDKKVMATDQLLNLIYLVFQGNLSTDETERAKKVLFRGLQD